MGISTNVDRMRENFEAQFEPAGEDKYLYRRNQKGPAIPVTTDERERFVRQYVRSIWFIMWGMMVVLLAFWGLAIWWTLSARGDFPDVTMYVGTGVITVGAIVPMYWMRGAPARELEGRTPVAAERSTEQTREMMFHKMTYGQLAGAAAFGPLVPVMMAFGRHPIDVFHGWGRLWLVLGAALTLFAAVQAFRKWRFEIDHPSGVI